MTFASTISTSSDYLEPLRSGFASLTSTAQRAVDPKTRRRPLKEIISGSYQKSTNAIDALTIGDDVDGGLVENLAVADLDIGDVEASKKLDEVRGIVRSFEQVQEGWDGPDSSRPVAGVIQDALEVLQNWVSAIDKPEPALAFDGTVALELYDDEGLTRGGIEFVGQHRAVFTIISDTNLISSGTFDAGSPGEIIRSIAEMRRALSAT